MKQVLNAFLIGLLAVLLISGCASGSGSVGSADPTIQGIIMDINDASKRILVTKDVSAEEAATKSVEDILNEGKPAYWFNVENSEEFSRLSKGQRVEVSIKGGTVAESYPMQGTASKVVILK